MSDVLLNQIKSMATQLSPLEKAQLADWLEADTESESRETTDSPRLTHFKDMFGAWSDVHVTDEDIEEVRREMMRNFPREDI